MAQRDNKTGQKGLNAMSVVTQYEIHQVLKAGKKFTYANPVVEHCPQKEDSNRIQITAGGNLIDYDDELSAPMVDLVTAKLHPNSAASTALAKYMCIDLKPFYLTAQLEYFEYMTIPLALFPPWIMEQYDLNKHALNGKVYIELRHAVWGFLRQEY
jgi:hypothetical protein